MVLERVVMEKALVHEAVHQQGEQEVVAFVLSVEECCPWGPFAVGSASFQVGLADRAMHR